MHGECRSIAHASASIACMQTSLPKRVEGGGGRAPACAQRRARVHGMSWRHNCHASSAAPPDGDKNRDLNSYAALVALHLHPTSPSKLSNDVTEASSLLVLTNTRIMNLVLLQDKNNDFYVATTSNL